LLPAERAHHFTFKLVKALFVIPGVASIFKSLYHYQSPKLVREVFGIEFPNPVGLAAGFDKDAQLVDPLATMGFGFIEIGTVTPVAQVGNPQPRLFRLPVDQGLINRMGFNNKGAAAAVAALKRRNSKVIVGGNIGKNKVTPNEEAKQDYIKCFNELFPWVDYFVVNVSSPNTPGLRQLQEKEPLMALLQTLQDQNKTKPKPKPILLKIAPDLNDGQLDDIISIVQETQLSGIVATNTTIDRSQLKTEASQVNSIGAGGLSGQPLKSRATEVIRYLHQNTEGKIPIIGVGGIQNGADAWDKLQAGASLIQVYTGFIYEGPGMVKQINRYLANRL